MLTLCDSIDVDQVVRDHGRLVEFKEAYDYNASSCVLRFLRYWKQVSNIYDLEFFTSKLASSAFAISNVERMVMSGVPFYEDDGEENNFMSDIEEDASNDDEGARRRPREDNRFDQAGHNPLKNVLANIVAEKIAQEKRDKMQLVTDLESIKEKFVGYQNTMKR